MKICLVRPATITTAEAVGEDAAPPLGLAYIAAFLKKDGHEVNIVDALGEALSTYTRIENLPTGLRHGLSDKEAISLIPNDTQVIGVSCMFSLEWPFVRDLINGVRKEFPDAIIVAGGEHMTALPEYSLRDSGQLDYVVLGEGEYTIAELLTNFESGGSIEEIPGLAFLEKNKYRENSQRARQRKLEDIPWPAWELVPLQKYFDKGIMTGVDFGRSMPILASRGCPYQCTFCSNPVMWGTLWRARSPQDVLSEMQYYYENYQIENFDFYDLTAIVKRSWIIEFCHLLIDSGMKISWQLPSGTRSEAIDQEVTALLAQTGCAYMNYAPESGSDETLKKINKRINKKNMLESMRHAVDNRICVKANFILGFPDEGFTSVWQTYKFAVQMALIGIKDASFFPFSPYPGSLLFQQIHNEGGITIDDEFFYSLSQYTDPRYARSYAKNFSKDKLRFLCLFGMMLFYLISFIRRPLWAIQLISQVKHEESKTKLSASLVRIIRKRRELSVNK